jgi:hypothetical protein
MSEYRHTFYVERGEEELELVAVLNVEPYIPAKISGPPENSYPEEGGDCEIEAILKDNKLWDGTLTKSEKDNVIEYGYQEAIESFNQVNDDQDDCC